MSVEALVRLEGEAGRIYLPNQFIPDTNDDALRQITHFMLLEATREIASLDADGFALGVSINVVPRLLTDPDCLACFHVVLDRCPLPASRITLELLETSEFINQSGAMTALNALADIGVRLALDDLGTGFSSLARLRDLPIGEMKLDFSFVRGLQQKPSDMHFLLALRELADRIHCNFVAEGVETPAILDAMLALRIPFLQGYAIARPMPFAELRAFLQTHDQGFVPPTPGALGVYGCLLCHDGLLRRLVDAQPTLSATARIFDATACRVHRRIQLAGLAGTELDRLHRRYHAVLTRCAETQALQGTADWRELNAVETEMEAWLIQEIVRGAADG